MLGDREATPTGTPNRRGMPALVIEGDKIVGETPRLAPGEEFSYNSYHVTGANSTVNGSFHGVDEFGNKIHVLLAPFDLNIPQP